MRAAVVGGVAYHAGKKVQEGRDQDDLAAADEAQPLEQGEPSGITDEGIEQLQKLAQLKEQGIITEAEFEEQKRKILDS